METPAASTLGVMVGEVGYALRLPRELRDELKRLAELHDRSLNSQIVRVLREWAEREGEQVEKP